jgi:dynein heavy chain
LKTTIEECIVSKELQTHQGFVMKVIQLFETFNVRFGVMIVGPTGAGKTTCYEVLSDTMTTMRERNNPDPVYQIVKKKILNPKAISMGEMYGEVNQLSQEWFDGLASKIMRSAAQEIDEDRAWVVFDGPVDALWIENMNTVLDDNMTLCLANGQRIKLRSQMKMLFEVQDLAVASPATVSRCGMVYMTASELGWRPFVKTWIKTYFQRREAEGEEILSEALKIHLFELFEYTVDAGLSFIRENLNEPIKTTDLQQVTSLCNYLESFLHEDKGFKGLDADKKKILEDIFAWSYAWSLGGSLDQQGKDKFDYQVKD